MKSNPKTAESGGKGRLCPTCLYISREDGPFIGDKCLRFARFVDHVLHEGTRDCEYWEPAA